MKVFESIRHNFIFSQITGLFPFETRQANGSIIVVETRMRLAWTLLSFTAGLVIVGLFFVLFLLTSNPDFVPELSARTILLLSMILMLSSIPTVFYLMLSKKKLLCYWLNQFDFLFACLRKDRLKRVARFNVTLLWGTLLLIAGLNISESILAKKVFKSKKNADEHYGRAQIVFFLFYLVVIQVKTFCQYFIIFVNLLNELFKEVHRIFRSYGTKLDCKYWVVQLRFTRMKYLLVTDFVNFLHSFFMPAISLQLCCGFLSTLFNVTIAARAGVPPVVQLLWAIYVVFDVLLLVVICEMTETEAEKTGHFLLTNLIRSDDVQVKEEVELLSLQIQHTEVKFHALGLCRLNFTLLYSIIATLTSYIVIVLQFQHIEPSDGVPHRKVLTNCTSQFLLSSSANFTLLF